MQWKISVTKPIGLAYSSKVKKKYIYALPYHFCLVLF